MNIEYEIRILEVDESIFSKLEELGATKVGQWHQRRFVYDTIPKKDGQWFRLRTDGEKTTLTYKNIEKDTIDGPRELEIEVSDFDKTSELLKIMGYNHRAYQENKRVRYVLDDVEIDIDTWPLIPTYMEIEGNSEEDINNIIKKLSIDENKITTLNCKDIYKQFYNIDIDEISDLKF